MRHLQAYVTSLIVGLGIDATNSAFVKPFNASAFAVYLLTSLRRKTGGSAVFHPTKGDDRTNTLKTLVVAGSFAFGANAKPVRDIVLVHGTVADGALAWVYDELTGRGYTLSIIRIR